MGRPRFHSNVINSINNVGIVMRIFLILLGISMASISTFCLVYLVGLGCAMNTTGCRTGLLTLFISSLWRAEGHIYLFFMSISAIVFIFGLKYRK
jgi:hypothetical protein